MRFSKFNFSAIFVFNVQKPAISLANQKYKNYDIQDFS